MTTIVLVLKRPKTISMGKFDNWVWFDHLIQLYGTRFKKIGLVDRPLKPITTYIKWYS